jgi:hypothetical protein
MLWTFPASSDGWHHLLDSYYTQDAAGLRYFGVFFCDRDQDWWNFVKISRNFIDPGPCGLSWSLGPLLFESIKTSVEVCIGKGLYGFRNCRVYINSSWYNREFRFMLWSWYGTKSQPELEIYCPPTTTYNAAAKLRLFLSSAASHIEMPGSIFTRVYLNISCDHVDIGQLAWRIWGAN